MDGRAFIMILNPLVTSGEPLYAQVIDWCEPEGTLRLKEPMLVATVVQVRYHGRIALGEVRQCKPANGGYEIRVHFQDVLGVRQPT
jgi:hypothetical protein